MGIAKPVSRKVPHRIRSFAAGDSVAAIVSVFISGPLHLLIVLPLLWVRFLHSQRVSISPVTKFDDHLLTVHILELTPVRIQKTDTEPFRAICKAFGFELEKIQKMGRKPGFVHLFIFEQSQKTLCDFVGNPDPVIADCAQIKKRILDVLFVAFRQAAAQPFEFFIHNDFIGHSRFPWAVWRRFPLPHRPVYCNVAFSTILCTFQLSPPMPPPKPVCSRTLLTSPPRNPPAGSGMCTVWSVQLPRVRPPLTLFTGIDRPLFSSMITSQLSPALPPPRRSSLPVEMIRSSCVTVLPKSWLGTISI